MVKFTKAAKVLRTNFGNVFARYATGNRFISHTLLLVTWCLISMRMLRGRVVIYSAPFRVFITAVRNKGLTNFLIETGQLPT